MTDYESMPITDWSLSGRQAYVTKNKGMIDLIVRRSVEEFDEKVVFNIFGSIDKTVEGVIGRFLVPDLNHFKLPKKDISLFGELQFWIRHKTGGRASGKTSLNVSLDQAGYPDLACEGSLNTSEIHNSIELLINSLSSFNSLVAPDIVGYWMGANKKLLDGLTIPADAVVEHVGSDAKKTKYKADASFRFCYHFLALSEKLAEERHSISFESKYLVKGPNKPQYVSGIQETHIDKHNVRQFIKKVILFYEQNYNDFDYLVHCLIKPITRKSLLDQYEFDKESINEFGNKLKSLSKTKEVI